MEKAELIYSITEKIQDYGGGILQEHVEKWINQFDEKDQQIILQEINHIFEAFYLSRENAKIILRNILLDVRISGENPKEFLSKVNFIQIQVQGSSQRELLVLVDEILKEEFDISVYECQGSNVFFYLDDCVFTGNRFKHDLVPWIKNTQFSTNAKLICFHIAQHTKGYDYARRYIYEAAREKNIEISLWHTIAINNQKDGGMSPEVLWPMYMSDKGPIDDYYNKVKERCDSNGWTDTCYRNHSITQDELFSSPSARDIVEKAFLKIGSKLVSAAGNPAPSIRPLGFEKLESLGFGTFFITYRNISNNCPLALWYGDPNQSDGPLSLWYPLFIRKTSSNFL